MFVTVIPNILNLVCLLSILDGVAMGISSGAMPGLISTTGVAFLMPTTFSIAPRAGMLMLIGMSCGAVYGGFIIATLVNTSGTPSAAATVLDGYKFTKCGEAGRGLGISTVAFFGDGVISGIVLILVTPQLTRTALKFNAPESFALAFFGLSIITGISGRDMMKGPMSGMSGLLLSLIGMDNVTAYTCFSLGSTYLMGGLSFIPVLVDLFALSQCLLTVEETHVERTKATRTRNPLPSLKDLKTIAPIILRTGLTGTSIGIIPGAGEDISAFVSCDMERGVSKHPEKFGTDIPEGIAASEASNNGIAGGALIPLLTLETPRDANAVAMLGVLMMHNLTPGPQLFLTKVETVNTSSAGFMITNVFMLTLGFLGQPLFVKIVSIPKWILVPVIIVMCIVGSFAINNNYYDIIIMLIAEIVDYFMSKGGCPLFPIVLALILGPMAEGNLRRSPVMSQGSHSILLRRPFSAVFIFIGILSLSWPIISHIRRKRRTAQKG